MARISIKVVAVHEDSDSICEHPTAPTGEPRDPSQCTGRRGYRINCTHCGLTGDTHGIRSNADSACQTHRSEHAAVPATT